MKYKTKSEESKEPFNSKIMQATEEPYIWDPTRFGEKLRGDLFEALRSLPVKNFQPRHRYSDMASLIQELCLDQKKGGTLESISCSLLFRST